jgi:hypothetical protein
LPLLVIYERACLFSISETSSGPICGTLHHREAAKRP